MVSNVDSEENWNSLKQKLSTNRTKQLNKPPYDNVNSVKKLYRNSTLAPRLPDNFHKKSYSQNTPRAGPSSINPVGNNNPPTPKARKMVTINKNLITAYSPLSTPTNFRRNSSLTRHTDSYGLIPKIQSPYLSGREPIRPAADLDDWGVTADYMTRVGSPYLPVYHSILRSKPRSYVVVPSLTTNSNLNYIAPKPYNAPPLVFPSYHDFNSISATATTSYSNDELLRNARNVLDSTNPHNYHHGQHLFSTQFLEDLEMEREEPFRRLPNKILEPVKPTMQDMVFQHIYAEADAETFQTEGQNGKPVKKKNILKNAIKAVDGETARKEPKPPKPEKREIPLKIPTTKNSIAIDLAQVIYEQEMKKLVEQMAEASIAEQRALQSLVQAPIYDSIFESTLRKMLEDIAVEELNLHNRKIKMVQSNEIKKMAKEKIVADMMLDHMLDTVTQHGKPVAEGDDVSNLLDTMELNVLLHVNNNVSKSRDKTMKNYPLKKFCLNSFMNVALDILVAELSASLEEDIKELNDLELKKQKI